MRQHFEKLYNAVEAVTQRKEVSLPAPIPVDASEVHDVLRALPAGKAGLPGTSPGAVWRLCADQVAPLIAEDLQSRWEKQGTSPGDYRSIGLIDALGLQACLDMSSAFDLVPRSGLLEALHEAGVPEAPARLMLHWIERSTYRIRVQSLGVVLHTLRQHGMVINVQKVAVIIALNGPSRRQALSEFTRKDTLDPQTPCPPNQLFHRSLTFLRDGGLRKLLNAPLMPQLLHHCIVCGQWHERPHMIKMHIRSLHPEFFNSSEGATQLAARTGGAFSPCLYCAQIRAHPRQHLQTCTALWQACALHLHRGDGSDPGRRSDGGVFPVLGKRTAAQASGGELEADRAAKTGKPNAGGKGRGIQKGGGRRSATPTLQRGQGSQGQAGAEALKLVARTLVHQNEAIAALRQSTGWIWWLRIPEPSPIPARAAAQKWKEEIVKKDSRIKDRPLPQVLFWTMISFIKETVERMGEEEIQTAKTSGWMTAEGLWAYQRWNSETKCLEQDPTRAALKPEELSSLLADIIRLIQRETLSRFKALRTLDENLQGQSVPVLMDVGLRCPEATALFENLTKLQGNSSLQTSGVSFRREGFRKPPNLVKLLERVFG
eukprot:s5415_g2.t1